MNILDFLSNLKTNNSALIITIAVVLTIGLLVAAGIYYSKHKRKVDEWIIKRGNEIKIKEKGISPEYDQKITMIENDIDNIKIDMDETRNDIRRTHENINIINGNINKLIDKLDQYISSDKRRAVVTYRHQIYTMHKEFMAKGSITPTELKNFNEMVKEYEECGGNDIVHSKLKPDVTSLPINYKEGSY